MDLSTEERNLVAVACMSAAAHETDLERKSGYYTLVMKHTSERDPFHVEASWRRSDAKESRRQELRKAAAGLSRKRIAHFLDVVTMETQVYGAQDMPARLREILESEVKKTEPQDFEQLLEPFETELKKRNTGTFD